MTVSCYPVIEPGHLVHRAVWHAVRRKIQAGAPLHSALPHAQALPPVVVTAPKAVPAAHCVAVPGPLPAGPGLAPGAGPGAQPVFGGAFPNAAASRGAGFGGGGSVAGPAALPKAMLVAAALLTGALAAAVPGLSAALDRPAASAPAMPTVIGPDRFTAIPVPDSLPMTGADQTPMPVPEPGSLSLFAFSIVGTAFCKRWTRHGSSPSA